MEQRPNDQPGGPPPGPGWVQPSAPTPTGWSMPPQSPRKVESSGLAKVAAILLMVLGVIATLVGILFVVGGAIVKNPGDQTGISGFGDIVGGAVAVIGVIILLVGLIELVSGIGAWRGREWGRVIGLIYGVLGVLLGLLAVAAPRNSDVSSSGAGGGLVLLLVYGFITVVLAVRWRGATS